MNSALRVGVAAAVAIVLGMAALLYLSGCARARPVVDQTRASSNDAARALEIAERLQLARIRSLAVRAMDACEAGDKRCRRRAVDDAFHAESERVHAVTVAVATQREVASALEAYDACEGETACAGEAYGRLLRLSPAVASLVDDVRREARAP